MMAFSQKAWIAAILQESYMYVKQSAKGPYRNEF